MKRLVWELKKLHDADRSGSYQTRANRWTMLQQIAAALEDGGYRKLHASGLKPKHVEYLRKLWVDEVSPRTGKQLSPGTIKNRFSALRWLATAVGKPNIVPASNDDLGVPRRQYGATQDRSEHLKPEQLARVSCQYVRISLQLQAAFGLRREEAIKFKPSMADKGDHIHLLGPWCKGGRPRSVPILTPAQRSALDAALKLAPKGSLIPSDKRYVEHLAIWKRETRRIDLPRTHGLRHAYAHARYRELMHSEAPVRGGIQRKNLQSKDEKDRDLIVRTIIAEELGHSRPHISSDYIGR